MANVRFFLGTREEYNNLAQHNPLGLYFCTDTCELFRGDQLLTDGIRTVEKYADLPSFSKAADGIIYYVCETRNGYMIAPDRTKWLQVIYSPVSDLSAVTEELADTTVVTAGAVKGLEEKLYSVIDERIADIETGTGIDAISFAGVEFTDVNGTFSIDRACARRALGFNVPEGKEDEELEIATKDYVDEQLAAATGVDLSAYAKKEDIPDTSKFITMQDVEDKNYLTEIPEGFATESYVNEMIAKAELGDKEVNLEAYYTKDQVDALIPDVSEFIKEIPSEYITEEELESKGYLTDHQDLSNYAKKTDIPSIEGLASKSYVDEKVASASIDLTGYATESWVEGKNYLEPEDLTDYAKKNELFSKDYNDLDNKPEIPSIEGLATEDFVKEEIAKIDIPDVSAFITSIPEEYVTEEELASEGFIKEHQSLAGYATEDYVKNAIAEAELNDKDIDISGLATKDDLKTLASIAYVDEKVGSIEIPVVNLDGYATELYVNNAIDEINLTDYAKKADIPTDYIKEIPAEYITESELNAKGYITEHQDISHLATRDEIPDVSGFIKAVPEEYITEDELTAKGYITEHQSLEGYATEQYVTDAINNIEFPETDLTGYYNKSEIDTKIAKAVSTKADNIPFTTNKYVTKQLGGFVIDDNLNGFTIAQILAKLLELSDTPVNSTDEPVTPEDPTGIVATIIADKIPMYAVTADGTLEVIPYNYIELTEESAEQPPQESGFYQIKDASGNVIESGYQELQADSDDVYYIIALPKDVDYNTMVTVRGYDANFNVWRDAEKFKFVSDPTAVAAICDEAGIDISHIDTEKYTVWAIDECPTGSKLRFIINE